MIQGFKILNQIDSIPVEKFFTLSVDSRRCGQKFKVRPKIKKLCVSGYSTVPNFLLHDPNFLKHFQGISNGFPGSAILFPHLPSVKTFKNK